MADSSGSWKKKSSLNDSAAAADDPGIADGAVAVATSEFWNRPKKPWKPRSASGSSSYSSKDSWTSIKKDSGSCWGRQADAGDNHRPAQDGADSWRSDQKKKNAYQQQQFDVVGADYQQHIAKDDQQRQRSDLHKKKVLKRGKVARVVVEMGYGFLSPCSAASAAADDDRDQYRSSSNTGEIKLLQQAHEFDDDRDDTQLIFFRFSKTASGLLTLQHGDLLEYIPDSSCLDEGLDHYKQLPKASHARLLQCSFRCSHTLACYLSALLQLFATEPDVVLREITKSPAGLLLVLAQPDPSDQLVILVMKLVDALSNWQASSLYTSRMRQFYNLFAGAQYLTSQDALTKIVVQCSRAEQFSCRKLAGAEIEKNFDEQMFEDNIEREWKKPLSTFIPSVEHFLLKLLRQSPDLAPSLRPLLQAITSPSSLEDEEDNKLPSPNFRTLLEEYSSLSRGKISFLLSIINAIGQAKASPDDPLNLSWDKMGLLLLDSEFATPFSSLQLPVVVKEGTYGSADNYIETYFRLLREDCFGPLKKGISDFQSARLDPKDMRIWVNVSVMGVHFAKTTPGLIVALKCHGGDSNCHNELPVPGNLLCISDDGGNFLSPIWAIAVRCEKITKQRGALVFFIEVLQGMGIESNKMLDASILSRILKGTNMIVAESPSYYKAYHPVLKALQRIDPVTMPFQEELVHVKWPEKAPDYLKPYTWLDWACLLDEGSMHSHAHCFIGGVDYLDVLLEEGFVTILDQSQINAVNHVLKNRLAIIQGPPGTGKTFLGVRILQLLLSASTLPPRPVLVMTHKNKALDEFLESCLSFCPKPGSLVRVGGRSTNVAMMQHNLSVLVEKRDKFLPDWMDNCTKLEELQVELQNAIMDLHRCRTFNANMLISHAPSMFLCRLLSGTDSGKSILKLLPEGFSLIQLLEDVHPTSSKFYVSTQLRKTLFDTVKSWMPQKTAFSSVEVCLSSGRPPQPFNKVLPKASASRIDSKNPEQGRPEDFEEDDEDLESIVQDMQYENAANMFERSDNAWLYNNFLRFEPEEDDALVTGFQLFDLSAEDYYWMFQLDPWKMAVEHRCILILVIMQQEFEAATKRLSEVKEKYDHMCSDNDEINKRRRAAVLQDATIIGMTTTGAAMNQDILAVISPSVVIVEEAAETLEPHIIAVLRESVEHLILIGDHCQLRPSVKSHELERRYNFGVSMFERLAEHNKLPFQALNFQSRMREEFVPMLLPIYPNLKSNTEQVSGYRNQPPQCMASTMYFWSHSFKETVQRSFANEGEALMVVALSKWLLSEGHKPEEISVICAYNGQVSLLRKKFECLQQGDIKVHTIDGFQGSENHIIIASLVRSNSEGHIGHLASRNRLCVSVSRARSAVYICGNATLLSEKSPHWDTLLKCFRSKDCFGDIIFLQCPRHPHIPPFPLSSEDAQNFAPRLCTQRCRAPLPCGHFCADSCHNGDHAVCKEEVPLFHKTCGHTSIKLCSDDEAKIKCEKEVWFNFETCGHIKHCTCWEKTNASRVLKCDVPCGKILDCTHPCLLSCSDECSSSPCSKCAEIAKINSAKERELIMRDLKDKIQKIDSELELLKTKEESGPVFTELLSEGETAVEYHMVRDRTEKFIQPSHMILPVVTRIQKVGNLKVQIRFLEAQRDLIDPTAPSQLLFHGTNDEGVDGITHNGFQVHGKDNMFGKGCYFATDSSKSAQSLYTKGSNKLLLCEVLLGRSWSVQQAKPELDLQTVRKKGYDSVFSMRNSKDVGGTEYDEFVIYNPNQAIARYIVHYKNLDCNAPELKMLGATKFTRTSLKASQSSFSGDNAEEYHFRFAESQFLRMSERKDQKVQKVEYIYNELLARRYEIMKKRFMDQKKPTEEMLVFHGTTEENINKIIQEGFKIGGDGVPIRCGTVYGKGVYTAVNPEVSVPYSSGSGMMLLSIALPGKEKVDYKNGGANVLVLQHVDQLLPRYIVHFS